jgi:nitrous oxidase accessory protein
MVSGCRGLLLALALAGWPACGAVAATITVAPGEGALVAALAAAAPHDVLRLQAGRHVGPIRIDKPVTLEGEEGAAIEGPGEGVVVTVDAPDVVLRGLRISGSGLSLETMDAGVTVTEAGDRAQVLNNHLADNLIGVHLEGPDDARVAGNLIEGRRDLRMNERGNGVYVWNTPGSVVEGNRIRFGRDGIFVNTSQENSFTGNHFEQLRFAIHYMYCNRSEVRDNTSVGNDIGYALMYSNHLVVEDNLSLDDQTYGIMFNYANHSVVRRNAVRGGPEKCVFLYNANKNQIIGNWFEACSIGVHFTAGSADNTITGNAFVDNQTQVQYVGSRFLDWSAEGRGNYWSDHPAYDLDGNGVADAVYRPNDLVDQVLWRQPLAKLLINSPVMQVLRWAQSEFPALLPGGVIDSAPLMQPVRPAALVRAGEASG